jgi:hypothetical protein
MTRWRLLISPVFTGAVALLAVNDHLLKDQWPGVVTGKLSDFAGVAVVAILLATVLRPGTAVAVTAGGFVALKAISGVNELAAPVLGGVTLTDRSDLIALIILWPIHRWLTRPVDRERTSGPSAIQWRSLLAIPALGVAVLATTATSCTGPEGVNVIAVEDDVWFAGLTDWELGEDVYADRWMASEDGGRTWHKTDHEPGDDATFSAEEFCAGSTCWTAVVNDRLRFCRDGSPCRTATSVSDYELADRGKCTWGNGWFNSVIVIPDGDDSITAVAMGSGGILVQTDDGEWETRSVRETPPSAADRTISVAAPFLLLVAGPFLIRAAVSGRRPARTGQAIGVLIAGGAVLLITAMVGLYVSGPPGWMIALLSVAVFGLSVWVALIPRRERTAQPW